VYLTHAGDGSGRLFVVEQAGQIKIITDGKSPAMLFLDITALVDSSANERGLLSIAFHPDYKSNGFFFVNYTRQPDGATVIARYHVSNDPNVADPDSAVVILTIPQPEVNHNGGLVKFGPDGYLYIGMGDGGGGGDRHGTIGNGQDLTTLLGKILRIDVNGSPYAIPASNPFRGKADARPEIWAYGLRNPWRWSFDRRTGDLYIADVGQNVYEEIDFQPASSSGGENYGWRLMEGKHCFNPSSGCEQAGLTMPVAEYSHSDGCSVTGGYVYRGVQYPWLDGLYFFADYCSGKLWTLSRDPSGAWEKVERAQVDSQPSSFGEDQAGELYLVGHGDGTIYRLVSTAL
jgi:glucose/arabinose dehydrogenase